MINEKPIILVTPNVKPDGTVDILPPYLDALTEAGAEPRLVPYTQSIKELIGILDTCDGICFTGGVDINPERYFEKISRCGETNEMRDKLELSLFALAAKKNKPIMGICCGAQLINVALGGTLYQDIPAEIETLIQHIQKEPKFEHSHYVNIVLDTPLYDLIGMTRIEANSFHHQAIKRLGEGLLPMATADDGIIEAIFSPNYKYLRAYQWHPERICQNDENQQKIFKDFILACKEK